MLNKIFSRIRRELDEQELEQEIHDAIWFIVILAILLAASSIC